MSTLEVEVSVSIAANNAADTITFLARSGLAKAWLDRVSIVILDAVAQAAEMRPQAEAAALERLVTDTVAVCAPSAGEGTLSCKFKAAPVLNRRISELLGAVAGPQEERATHLVVAEVLATLRRYRIEIQY